MVVVDGDVLYEYSFTSVRLDPIINDHLDFDPALASYTSTGYNAHIADIPSTVRYRLTSILNRTGDRIDFSYAPQSSIPLGQSAAPYWACPEFVATWKVNGQTQVSITINEGGCTYSGGSGAHPSFTFTGFGRNQTIPVSRTSAIELAGVLSRAQFDSVTGPWDLWNAFSIQSVQDLNTGDYIRLNYGVGPAMPSNTMFPWAVAHLGNPNIANVLSSVEMPGRTLFFQWASYPFRYNAFGAEQGWAGYKGVPNEQFVGSVLAPSLPPEVVGSCFAGVVGVDEVFPTGQHRSTIHNRRVPIPTYNTEVQWDSTVFDDAIEGPDGQVTWIRFVEPVPNRQGGPSSSTFDEQYQTLAHLKHQVRETRHYATRGAWQADMNSAMGTVGTQAYRIEFLDRLDLRSLGNPSGEVIGVGTPFATRTRTWDGDASTLTVQEKQNWNAQAYAWGTKSQVTVPWNTSSTLLSEVRSLALRGLSPETLPSALSTRTETTSFENHGDMYQFGLPIRRTVHRVDDSSLSDPATDPPAELFSYEEFPRGVYRLKTKGSEPIGIPVRTLTYNYKGVSGLSAVQVDSLFLSEAGASLSNQVGIESFGYDEAGNLTSILPKGGFSVGQTQDQLGFVTSQTNANGLRVQLSRDGAGRITGITPPNGEVSTSITYDPDTLGYQVTRGAQVSRMRFNGVGQPILAPTWKKDIVYVGAREVADVSPTSTTLSFMDHLGSPQYLWSGSGAPVVQKFLPFGETLADPTSASKFAKGFTNHEQTDPSGLIYMQARFYAPWYGRFLSPDPGLDQHFQETQSWNIYSYVQNNPTMHTDPTGMFLEELKAYAKGFGSQLAKPFVASYNSFKSKAAFKQAAVSALAFGLSPMKAGVQGAQARVSEVKSEFKAASTASDYTHALGGVAADVFALASPFAKGAGTPGVAPALDAAGEPAGALGTIYRGGGSNPGNLTLRAGEEALSFRDGLSNPIGGPAVLRPGQPYIGVDASKLPAGSVVADGVAGSKATPPGHVSVTASPEAIQAAIIEKGKIPK